MKVCSMVETLRNTKTSNGETQGWSPAPVGFLAGCYVLLNGF